MDKTERYLDALEHPDRYSDEELAEIMADPDTQEIISLLGKTKSALQNVSCPDIEAEWQRFANAYISSEEAPKCRNIISALFSRHAAASIAVIVVSVAALTAAVSLGVNMLSSSKQSEKAITQEIPATKHNGALTFETTDDETISPTAQTVIFDNQPLDSILTDMAEFYYYKLNFSNEEVKSLRLYFKWNQGLPLNEVVEELNNFEQINIHLDTNTITIN